MRITKIVEKTPIINENGKWNVFCQVQRGSSYVYGVILFDTMKEAFELKEGQILDAEKTRFKHRIKNL